MRTNKASAEWRGNLKEGKGSLELPGLSKSLAFSFSSRFEDAEGSNPEELIAAAHAGCFSMALSGQLAANGFQPKVISTDAKVTIDKKGEGFAITKSELSTSAEIPGISEEQFKELAETAKKNCPVSQALASVEISLVAKLV